MGTQQAVHSGVWLLRCLGARGSHGGLSTLTQPALVSRSPCTRDWKCPQTWGGRSCRATSPQRQPCTGLREKPAIPRLISIPQPPGQRTVSPCDPEATETCFLLGDRGRVCRPGLRRPPSGENMGECSPWSCPDFPNTRKKGPFSRERESMWGLWFRFLPSVFRAGLLGGQCECLAGGTPS